MKIVTWNCQGAFRKKIEHIRSITPDILLVQECEHPDKIQFKEQSFIPKDSYWYSDDGKKGIALFSFSDFKFELLREFNPTFRYVLPFRVYNGEFSFTLFAVWAMNNRENYDARYIGQVWLAINYYNDLIGERNVLIGDFNSNKIWDQKDRVGNHSDVVNMLAGKDISSAYHKFFEFEHGREKHPTFYLYRKKGRPYHIDYCFVSSDFYKKLKEVEIGEFEKWTLHSDHVPLSVNFDMKL